MEELVKLLEQFWTEVFDVKAVCGIAVAILIFILEVRFMRKRKKRDRRLEKAKQMGHVVQAKRTKAWDDDITGYSVDSWFHAAYSYEVNGRTYEYRYMGKKVPPLLINLYYIDNPARAFTGEEKKERALSILLLLFPIVVGVVVFYLLGGIE